MKTLPSPLAFFALIFSILFASCNQPTTRDDEGERLKQISPLVKREVIPVETAREHIKKYISSKQSLVSLLKDSNFLKTSFDLPQSEGFSKESLLLLLANPKTSGIQAYLGNKNGQVKIILVAIDKDGNPIHHDLLDSTGNKPFDFDGMHAVKSFYYFGSGGQAIESDLRCPLACPSPL